MVPALFLLPFPHQRPWLGCSACSSRKGIAAGIATPQALPNPKAHRWIFFHLPNIEGTDSWGGGTEMVFKMPNSVMLEHIPALGYKATWIYWWSERGGTKIRIN